VKNPFDQSHKYAFDLPAEGEVEEEEREKVLGPDPRESAQKQKVTSAALTESRGFAILAEFAEEQRQKILNQLLLETITDKNKDEFNFLRGQVAGLLIAVKYGKALAEGAEATIELLNEARKADNAHGVE
jgi:hypothetical protein